MKTSIATVCLSGGLSEKLQAIAAAGFRGVEIFESDLLSYQRHAGRRRQGNGRSRPEGDYVPAVPRFRGHAGAATRPHLRPRRAQVRPDAGTRLRPADGLQQRVAGIARRHRPRGRRLPRTRRARRQARPARRLRGAGLGPPHQRLPRCLGGGAARRSSGGRPGARQLPYAARARPTSSRCALSPATGSSWCSSPTRPGSTWTSCRGAGISAVSRARAKCRCSNSCEAVLGHRLRRRILARDIQRPVPRRLAALGRGRRPALAGLPDGPVARQTGAAKLEIPAMPPRSQCLGVEFIEFAADDHTADELARFISGLGFQRSGDSTNRRR